MAAVSRPGKKCHSPPCLCGGCLFTPPGRGPRLREQILSGRRLPAGQKIVLSVPLCLCGGCLFTPPGQARTSGTDFARPPSPGRAKNQSPSVPLCLRGGCLFTPPGQTRTSGADFSRPSSPGRTKNSPLRASVVDVYSPLPGQARACGARFLPGRRLPAGRKNKSSPCLCGGCLFTPPRTGPRLREQISSGRSSPGRAKRAPLRASVVDVYSPFPGRPAPPEQSFLRPPSPGRAKMQFPPCLCASVVDVYSPFPGRRPHLPEQILPGRRLPRPGEKIVPSVSSVPLWWAVPLLTPLGQASHLRSRFLPGPSSPGRAKNSPLRASVPLWWMFISPLPGEPHTSGADFARPPVSRPGKVALLRASVPLWWMFIHPSHGRRPHLRSRFCPAVVSRPGKK